MGRLASISIALLALLAFPGLSVAEEPAAPAAETVAPEVSVKLEPREATLGDPLTLEIRLRMPGDALVDRFDPVSAVRPFELLNGEWVQAEEPSDEQEGASEAADLPAGTRLWRGTIAAYELGELELPPLRFTADLDGETLRVQSEPVKVQVVSVLDPEEAEAEAPPIAEIKGQASVAPNYMPLWLAGGALLGLLAVAALAWWLVRRYGKTLQPAAGPSDPFERKPAHEWAYAELQALLDRRLPEQGQFELFHQEVARILKRYLSGRYRLELMEHTTDEVADLLGQGGCPGAAIDRTCALLRDCDVVKFARQGSDVEACRGLVERTYAVIDETRPHDAPVRAAGREGAA